MKCNIINGVFYQHELLFFQKPQCPISPGNRKEKVSFNFYLLPAAAFPFFLRSILFLLFLDVLAAVQQVEKLPSLSRLGHPLFPLMKKAVHFRELLFSKTGNDLFSQAVSRQVSSALKSLTSVFGMGTGGSSSPLSPDFILSFLSTQTMKNLSSLTSLRLSPSLG